MIKDELELARIAVEQAQENKAWRDAGHELSVYLCPRCDRRCSTPKPLASNSPQGYQDRLRPCNHCGNLAFIRARTNGEVIINFKRHVPGTNCPLQGPSGLFRPDHV